MSIAPIGVFDSGVGGLQLVQHLSKHLPEESIYYLADNLRMPYGNRDPKEVIELAKKAAATLERLGCKMVVIACNTVSSIAFLDVQKAVSIPVVGIIESCSKEAKHSSKNNIIGLLATPNTIDSKKYNTLLKSVTLVTSKAPDIALLIEKEQPVEEKLHHYLTPLKRAYCDTLILGCTHYPFIKNLIQQQMGPDVRLIDSTSTCIEEIEYTLKMHKLQAPKECVGNLHFFATNPTEGFDQFVQKLFGYKTTFKVSF